MKDADPESTRQSIRKQVDAFRFEPETELDPTLDVDTKSLLQELRAHQLELELQNEALQNAYIDLQSAHRRYADLFEFAPMGYVILNLEGVIVQVNSTCLQLLDVNQDELLDQPFEASVSPSDRNRYSQFRRQLMDGEAPGPFETQIVRQDGTQAFCLIIGQLQPGEHGQSNYLRLAIGDDTQRHELQKTIAASEAKVQGIIEQSTDGIVLTDEDGYIIVWSPGQARITGVPSEEAVGKRVWDVSFTMSPSDDRRTSRLDLMRRRYQTFLRHGMEDPMDGFYEGQIVRPSGQVRWIEQMSFSIPGDTGYLLGGIVRDVTEHKIATESLHQRNTELNLLNRVGQAVVSTLALSEVLETVLNEVIEAFAVNGACIWLVDGENGKTEIQHSGDRLGETLSLSPITVFTDIAHWVVENAQSLAVPVASEESLGNAESQDGGFAVRSCLCTPLRRKNKVVGAIQLLDEEMDRFDRSDIVLLEYLAVPAALAVENAQLFDEANMLSVLRERQRLTRRLHDSFNQSLFSASLIAEVLPRTWERDPDEGRAALIDLRKLLRGALAEQRSALAELRPSDLSEADLNELILRVADGFTGRTNVPVEFAHESHGALPGDVHVMFYRLCQEALSNIAKHASANHVSIDLRYDNEAASMRIVDDGRGFDVDQIPHGHYGLQIMRERAHAVGARLSLTSAHLKGTTITVRWMRSTPVDSG